MSVGLWPGRSCQGQRTVTPSTYFVSIKDRGLILIQNLQYLITFLQKGQVQDVDSSLDSFCNGASRLDDVFVLAGCILLCLCPAVPQTLPGRVKTLPVFSPTLQPHPTPRGL